MDRNEAIAAIKTALQKRSGKSWSVTGGRGTAYGWITIDAPPARRTSRYMVKAGCSGQMPEDYEKTRTDTGEPGGSLTEADAAELGKLLGLERVHNQGVSIMASNDARLEYIDRANGRTPAKIAEPYWD